MTGSILLLVAGYVLLAIMVLALCLFSHWAAWLKTLLILLFGAVFVLSYDAALLMLGSPTVAALPPRFVLHDVLVQPPEQATGGAGAIYLWITPLAAEANRKPGAPRAHRLPYAQGMAKRLSAAQEKMDDGIIQIGETSQPEQAEGATILGRLLGTRQSPEIVEFKDLPAPALPEK